MDKKFIQLIAWYLNIERITQLLGNEQLLRLAKSLESTSGIVPLDTNLAICRSHTKKELENWLHSSKVDSLEKLLSEGNLREGSFFTYYKDFYCRGLPKYYNNIPKNAVAEIHTKLKLNKKYRLRVKYHPDNLTCTSAWGRLGGHSRLFVFGYVESVNNYEILARPYVIGDVNTEDFNYSNSWIYSNYGELHITDIDSFSKVKEYLENEKKHPNLEDIKSISEMEIKKFIAEIISEGSVPKDWGGEKSDLFTNNIFINGRKTSSAFLLKGPAKFHKMKVSDLGKNGDQIDRLFSEPAELLILQHCHEVSPEVRSMMRAYASRVFNLKHFMIIDGYDTLRLLRAYNKIK